MINKNILFLAFSFLLANFSMIICVEDVSKQYELVEEALFLGNSRIMLYDSTQKPKKKLGVISISKASYLKPLSEVPKALAEKSSGFLEIFSLVGVLTTKKYDFEKTLVLGDLYIFPDLRGKGYAKNLVEKACKKVFESGADTIVLIPQPFEYIDGKQVILSDKPGYQSKVEKLMKLYGKCGFTKIDSEQNFMVLSKKQSDPITTIKS